MEELKTKRSGLSKKIRIMKFILIPMAIVTIGIFMYLKLSRETVTTDLGEFAEHQLPDGSMFYLNAESSISFAPFWWKHDPSVKFEGEVFFDLVEGSQVFVKTGNKVVEAKGASFNIYARSNIYQVYCKSGTVRVTDIYSGRVDLVEGEYTSLEDGILDIELMKEEQILSWRKNEFNYAEVSLMKVLIDMKRHYNVYIWVEEVLGFNTNYTGRFTRDIPVESALDTVCLALNLNYYTEKIDTFIVEKIEEL